MTAVETPPAFHPEQPDLHCPWHSDVNKGERTGWEDKSCLNKVVREERANKDRMIESGENKKKLTE